MAVDSVQFFVFGYHLFFQLLDFVLHFVIFFFLSLFHYVSDLVIHLATEGAKLAEHGFFEIGFGLFERIFHSGKFGLVLLEHLFVPIGVGVKVSFEVPLSIQFLLLLLLDIVRLNGGGSLCQLLFKVFEGLFADLHLSLILFGNLSVVHLFLSDVAVDLLHIFHALLTLVDVVLSLLHGTVKHQRTIYASLIKVKLFVRNIL